MRRERSFNQIRARIDQSRSKKVLRANLGRSGGPSGRLGSIRGRSGRVPGRSRTLRGRSVRSREGSRRLPGGVWKVTAASSDPSRVEKAEMQENVIRITLSGGWEDLREAKTEPKSTKVNPKSTKVDPELTKVGRRRVFGRSWVDFCRSKRPVGLIGRPVGATWIDPGSVWEGPGPVPDAPGGSGRSWEVSREGSGRLPRPPRTLLGSKKLKCKKT